MAVVATYSFPWGTVEVCDDVYRDATPEQFAQREKRMWRTAHEILRRAELRRMQNENLESSCV